MRKTLFLGIAGILVAAAVAAAGAPASPAEHTSSKRAKTVRISTRKLPKLGRVLVNAKGLTLYMFVPDKHRRVTCKGTCAAVWPPVMLPRGAKAVGVHGAKTRLMGSDRDPAGGRVVTYHRWPLYTYVADRKPGQANGQALNLNGGLWYVLAPSGKVIRRK